MCFLRPGDTSSNHGHLRSIIIAAMHSQSTDTYVGCEKVRQTAAITRWLFSVTPAVLVADRPKPDIAYV